MKNIFKTKLFFIILGVFVCITSTVLAYSYVAQEIGFTSSDDEWDVENTKEALDDLHSKMNSLAYKKVCRFIDTTYSRNSNNHLSSGTKYECEVANNTFKTFYVLNSNEKIVNLIMDRNINTGTISWANAIVYFESGQPGNTIKSTWVNIYDIRLPSAQEIADASNITIKPKLSSTGWYCLGSGGHDLSSAPWCDKNSAAQRKMAYLFNHSIDCLLSGCDNDSDATTKGYWTTDIPSDNVNNAWYVAQRGYLESYLKTYDAYGVRPVITVLTTNLFE